eukprot:5161900-Prymnesium_polylepis.1
MRGLSGSRRVPSTSRADPLRAYGATLVRVSARHPRGAGRAGMPMRPARAPGRAGGRPARRRGRA